MLHSVAFVVRPTALVVGLLVLHNGTGLAYAAPAGFTPCQPADVEQMLFEREKSLLGPSHALQHLQMRKQQCEVERGTRTVPGKGIEMKASETLEDDARAKRAVLRRNSPVSKLRQGATQLVGGLTGSTPAFAQAVSTDPLVAGRWSAPFVIPVVGV